MRRRQPETPKASEFARIGDTIRGYDFKPMAGRPDCFVEGTVVGLTDHVGYFAYEIVCTRDYFDGVECEERIGKTIYIPFQVSFMEFPGRIMNLSR
jgi:hypothetical protein